MPRLVLDDPRLISPVLRQYTLAALVPRVKTTVLPLAEVIVFARKMNRALGSPWPSRVSVPLIVKRPVELVYTPGLIVPESTGSRVAVAGYLSRAAYKTIRSVFALRAPVVLRSVLPEMSQGQNPSIFVPGLVATLPEIVVPMPSAGLC